jgi:hypothetical protein
MKLPDSPENHFAGLLMKRNRMMWILFTTIVSSAIIISLLIQWSGQKARKLAGPILSSPFSWHSVVDARAAYQRWREKGVYGRRLVVFTGRWATVPMGHPGQPIPSDFPTLAAKDSPENIKSASLVNNNTVFAAVTLSGLARDLIIVIPRGLLNQRTEITRGSPGRIARPGYLSLPFLGYQRIFIACDLPPEQTPRIAEPVLIFVEPSFFKNGACGDVENWLAVRGLKSDLALVAFDDPAANDNQRAFAHRLATRIQPIDIP